MTWQPARREAFPVEVVDHVAHVEKLIPEPGIAPTVRGGDLGAYQRTGGLEKPAVLIAVGSWPVVARFGRFDDPSIV